jgi:hypothetical protein
MDQQQLQSLYEYMNAQGVSTKEMTDLLQSLPKWITDNAKAPCKGDGEAEPICDLGSWLALSNEDHLF